MEYGCLDGGAPTDFMFAPPLVLADGVLTLPGGPAAPGWGVQLRKAWLAGARQRAAVWAGAGREL